MTGIEQYVGQKIDAAIDCMRAESIRAARSNYDWLRAHSDDTALAVGAFGEIVFGTCEHTGANIRNFGYQPQPPCKLCGLSWGIE